MESDILIVGAGPVGLTLAVDLHRRGITPRIVDKVATGTNYSRAMVIHTRQQEQLAIAGVMDRMLRYGHPMRPTRVHTMGRYVGTLDLAGMDSPFPAPWMIYQSQIEAELESHLADEGVTVERGVEFLSLDQDQSSVQALLRGPDGQETVSSHRWLVGCDGARSPVRDAVGIAYSGRRYGEDVFQLGDVTLEGMPAETGGMWLGPKGTLVIIVPMHGHHRVIISYAVDALPAAAAAGSTYGYSKDELTIEELEDLTCRFGPKVKLSEPRWLARYGVEGRVAERYRDGRVFLAGDAAHIHLPLAGQWMNVGIGDAFNLGWKLALACTGAANDALLDSYTVERRGVAFGLSMANEKLWERVSAPPLWYRLGSPILGRFAFPRQKTQDRLRSNISQLAIAYPQSPIVADRSTWEGGVRAGDRAPDAPILGAGTTVHGMLNADVRGLLILAAGDERAAIDRAVEAAETIEKDFGDSTRCVVLSTAARSLAPAGEAARDDGVINLAVGSELYEKYGRDEGAAFHIRPDSHIGYAGPIDVSELRSYLAASMKSRVAPS